MGGEARKRYITIQLEPEGAGNSKRVRALAVRAGWAIHRCQYISGEQGPLLTVTHVDSGRALMRELSIKQATRLLAHVAKWHPNIAGEIRGAYWPTKRFQEWCIRRHWSLEPDLALPKGRLFTKKKQGAGDGR